MKKLFFFFLVLSFSSQAVSLNRDLDLITNFFDKNRSLKVCSYGVGAHTGLEHESQLHIFRDSRAERVFDIAAESTRYTRILGIPGALKVGSRRAVRGKVEIFFLKGSERVGDYSLIIDDIDYQITAVGKERITLVARDVNYELISRGECLNPIR